MPESPMESLKKSRDYKRIIENGLRENMETLTIYRLPNQAGQTRVGISVTRKAGGSVKRNLIKRRIREAIRRNATSLPAGEDAVLVARRGIEKASYSDIERDIRMIGGGKKA